MDSKFYFSRLTVEIKTNNKFDKVKTTPVFVILFVFSFLCTSAQDLHFTNNNFAPLYFNPAETGSFNGTIRVGAILRDQFSSFITNAYQSQSVYIDSPQSLGILKNDWVGLGLVFYNDAAGDIGFNNTGLLLSAAYHKSLHKKKFSVLSFGLQYGSIRRKVNAANNARWEDALLSGNASPDQALLEAIDENYNDLNFGIKYKNVDKNGNEFVIGLSMLHLLDPDFMGLGSTNTIHKRINANCFALINVGKKVNFKYGFYYSNMGLFTNRFSTHHNMNLFTQFFIELTSKKKRKQAAKTFELMTGLGYRFGDALQFFLGVNYERWQAGFAFDMTVSEAAVFTNSNGAIEFGLQHIINIYKEPEVDGVILCPKF